VGRTKTLEVLTYRRGQLGQIKLGITCCKPRPKFPQMGHKFNRVIGTQGPRLTHQQLQHVRLRPIVHQFAGGLMQRFPIGH
jgi:hypothetical protein